MQISKMLVFSNFQNFDFFENLQKVIKREGVGAQFSVQNKI
jgi:hypothetical protein